MDEDELVVNLALLGWRLYPKTPTRMRELMGIIDGPDRSTMYMYMIAQRYRASLYKKQYLVDPVTTMFKRAGIVGPMPKYNYALLFVMPSLDMSNIRKIHNDTYRGRLRMYKTIEEKHWEKLG